ncbi:MULTISPECIES: hypothetical protein [unclassified Lysinibacillus]
MNVFRVVRSWDYIHGILAMSVDGSMSTIFIVLLSKMTCIYIIDRI